MAGEQDIIKLLKSIDLSDPDSAAVGLARNFREIENKVGLIGGYLKQMSGGSVADIVGLAGTWTQAAWVASAALIAAAAALEVADGNIQGFFQAEEPAEGMYFGDIWIDTDKATPPDETCIYRYEDEDGGSQGTLAWRECPTSAVGMVYLSAYSAQMASEGKITTFYQDSVPVSISAGDFWVDTDDKNKLYRAAVVGADRIGTGQWEDAQDHGVSAATYIVADGATSNNIKNADYVVPAGVMSAQNTIQQAIDDLPSTGGKVLLLDGTYLVDGPFYLSDNVTLEGQGQNTIVKVKDDCPATEGFDAIVSNSDPISGNAGIRVMSFVLDGNHVEPFDERHNISFTKVQGSSVNGMLVQGAPYNGIKITSGDGITINNNTIKECEFFGIYFAKTNNSKIVANDASDNDYGGIGVDPAYELTANCNGNVVLGNTCNRNMGSGIEVCGDNHTIGSNVCVGNDSFGLVLAGGEGANVGNNVCSLNSLSGVHVEASNCNVVNNECSANSQALHRNISNIWIDGDYNNIQGNRCRRGTQATRPDYGLTVYGNRNLVTNNDLYQGGADGAFRDAGTNTVTSAGNRT